MPCVPRRYKLPPWLRGKLVVGKQMVSRQLHKMSTGHTRGIMKGQIMAERGLLGRLRSGLQKTRQALKEGLNSVFQRQQIDPETLEELEEVLITNLL